MRTDIFYILDAEHQPVHEPNIDVWWEWFENIDNRRVDQTRIAGGAISISTVFTGIDHCFDEHGPPLLFETLIFGGPLDGETWHYVSWDDAVVGHAAAVRRARTATGAIR